MEPNTKSGKEESAILLLVGDLCHSLNLKFAPVAVTWLGNFGHVTSLPSDQCVFIGKGPRRGFVVMPEAFRGKLPIEDWKPIIASCLIHQFQAKFSRVWRRDYALMLISMILPLVLLGIFLTRDLPVYAVIDTPFVFLAIFFPSRAYNYYTIRRSRLRADWKAAEIVGRDQFIHVLVKIDDLHILDLEELKKTKRTVWQRHVFPWPTMIERLDNLRISWKPPG